MKHSIRVNILLTFTVVFAGITALLLLSQYHFNKNFATLQTEKTFKMIRKSIALEINAIFKSQKETLYNINHNANIELPITQTYNHPALYEFCNILTINNYISAIYFADKEGNFFDVINYDLITKQKKKSVPERTKWIVIVSTDSQTFHYYLDKNKTLLQKKHLQQSYTPLTRKWYRDAIASDVIIATPLYNFSTLQARGISYAVETEKQGRVIGIDYTLKSLNKITKQQLFSADADVFLFDDNGDILYSLSQSKKVMDKKVDSLLFQKAKEESEAKLLKYREDGIYYFASFKRLKNRHNFIGIKVNATELLQPYIENALYSLVIALLFFLLSIPIIIYATEKIIQPIRRLIEENSKINKREFNTVTEIKTNILEFIELSESQVKMSKSIEAYQESQVALLDSIVKLIAEAVDAKSPYTGGHCKRVPEIALALIKEASNSSDTYFKSFHLEGKDALKEFEIAAWLHDCGKVTTPEYVVDKATKLESISNRIHEIRTRFEVLRRDAEIEYLQSLLDGLNALEAREKFDVRIQKLQDDFAFIAEMNLGGEFMDAANIERLESIAQEEWERYFDDTLGISEDEKSRYRVERETLPVKEKLISDKPRHIIKRENFDFKSYEEDGFKESVPEYLYNYGELYNLSIQKGTLTAEERYKINEHVIMSIKMLEKIPFPKEMQKIPEYAGTHHETLIGTGYPRKLQEEDLSIASRVMAIADIFEALSASDRPYKKAKKVSESLKIMSFMVKDRAIDGELFRLFLESGIYKRYAKKYLKKEQIDSVNIEDYLHR